MIISKSCNFGKEVATLQNGDRRLESQRRCERCFLMRQVTSTMALTLSMRLTEKIDDFAELDHLVDDITSIVDLELESDKAAEELATISDEHHVGEAG